MFRKEAAVKRAIKDILGEHGMWYTMPCQAGFSQPGVPDFICCYRGAFLAIEAKFGKNKPTAAQEHQINLIREAGGEAFVINEDSLALLKASLGDFNAQHKAYK